MPYIRTRDGTEIFYKDWGKGQPIVFSHGWPLSADAWDAQRAIMASEMAHNLGKLVDQGGESISRMMRDLVEEGRKVTAAQYLTAVAGAAELRHGLDQLFEQECTAIITPAAPGVAPRGTATGSPIFSTLWTYVGLPAITIPLMTGESGLPLGVQVIGASGDDARLLRTAQALVRRISEIS